MMINKQVEQYLNLKVFRIIKILLIIINIWIKIIKYQDSNNNNIMLLILIIIIILIQIIQIVIVKYINNKSKLQHNLLIR